MEAKSYHGCTGHQITPESRAIKTAWQGGFHSISTGLSMTNIVPLDKSRGFTRMDNQLMDGLLAIDLPAREMKIVLYVAKVTINFGAGAQRIPATDIAKAIHVHPDTVSKAISSLLRRRVLFREGGARGDIGVNDPKDWVYVTSRNRPKQPTRLKWSESAKSRNRPKPPTPFFILRKKPLCNSSIEEITCPQV